MAKARVLSTIVESTILQKFVPANRRQVMWAINSRLTFKPQGTPQLLLQYKWPQTRTNRQTDRQILAIDRHIFTKKNIKEKR